MEENKEAGTVENKMKLGVPIEYERGFIKFLNCKIDLSKRVFIPRIETEFWMKKALNELKIGNCRLQILDMFAGSGCIGIAILKACPELCRRVDFVDIDRKAIEQIKINLKLNKIFSQRYKIYKSNLFEKLKRKKYDYIFVNPPYVAKERLIEVQESVKKYEPKGVIYLEIDPLQKEEIEKILEKYNYSKFKFFKDQFKKYRCLKTWK